MSDAQVLSVALADRYIVERELGGPTPNQLMGVILGPRLRDNARYRALVPKLSRRAVEK